MSELINTNDNRATIRWKLLTTASAVALTSYLYSVAEVRAEDTERPPLWIELGGQLERMSGKQEVFSAPFFSQSVPDDIAAMTQPQRGLLYSNGAEGKISFSPEGLNWVFSAAIRYGRSNGSQHKQHQSAGIPPITGQTIFGSPIRPQAPPQRVFGDGQTNMEERHTVLDFQVGKDFGLGLFGENGSSVVSAGVRTAQFELNSDTTLHARPVFGIVMASFPGKYNLAHGIFHTYTATIHSSRTARGVGPSLSWDASLPFAGNSSDMQFTFDWGLNAAALFGRQRTVVHHQTTGYHYAFAPGAYPGKYTINKGGYAHSANPVRSRSVTIPNVGGFAGLSLKFPNAKISLGYRADFFFNAIDGGIDARKNENRGFMGPYASISIGLGD